ncbi:AAA family ATPase [Clostridium tagluense]|uniref:AAA family ATPase n=1 Tax=Clostridium tagluense TaxID=360422 RepID=UPI001CF36CCE|nr:AAA family ATPase [Clostridium tagluense]MCB2297304.1 AAA family ATPase [Clostridium tagluense]
MSMTNYQTLLKEIRNKILNNELKHRNSIIVGDNSSGKSEIVKQLLVNNDIGYYLIDSVNRTFDYTKVSYLDNLEKESYKNVLKFRLNEEKFNLQDSFGVNKAGTGAIEQIYFNYADKLKKLFRELLGIDFDIKIETNKFLGKVPILSINEGIDKISSGFQAIMRIFLEILYFEDTLEVIEDSAVVVIDEINEFLSPKNEEQILPFLMNQFPNLNFIVTTHSADVIASSINCNIIVLKGDSYECLDGDDFTTVTDVREIFSKIYNMNSDAAADIQAIEVILRNFLNIKISNQWTEVEEEKISEINENELSNIQKLLLKQIKSW